MRFKMGANLQRNGFRHQDRYCISYLFVLGDTRPKKAISIRERLEPSSFTYCQRAVLIRKKHRSPMWITLGHDSARKAIIA